MGAYRGSMANALEERLTLTDNAVTLGWAHADKTVYANGTGAQTYTIPLNATTAFEVGTKIRLVRYANQTLTVAATGGVTIVGSGASLTARARYSEIELVKIATDEWRLGGDVATA